MTISSNCKFQLITTIALLTANALIASIARQLYIKHMPDAGAFRPCIASSSALGLRKATNKPRVSKLVALQMVEVWTSCYNITVRTESSEASYG